MARVHRSDDGETRWLDCRRAFGLDRGGRAGCGSGPERLRSASGRCDPSGGDESRPGHRPPSAPSVGRPLQPWGVGSRQAHRGPSFEGSCHCGATGHLDLRVAIPEPDRRLGPCPRVVDSGSGCHPGPGCGDRRIACCHSAVGAPPHRAADGRRAGSHLRLVQCVGSSPSALGARLRTASAWEEGAWSDPNRGIRKASSRPNSSRTRALGALPWSIDSPIASVGAARPISTPLKKREGVSQAVTVGCASESASHCGNKASARLDGRPKLELCRRLIWRSIPVGRCRIPRSRDAERSSPEMGLFFRTRLAAPESVQRPSMRTDCELALSPASDREEVLRRSKLSHCVWDVLRWAGHTSKGASRHRADHGSKPWPDVPDATSLLPHFPFRMQGGSVEPVERRADLLFLSQRPDLDIIGRTGGGSSAPVDFKGR